MVAQAAAESGWPIRLNDQLVSATTLAAARLTSAREASFAALGGYRKALARLNLEELASGFIH